MNANVQETADYSCNGVRRLADSSPTRTTAKSLPNYLLSSRALYEESTQYVHLHRFPSPGKLWSDSEEVSDPVLRDFSGLHHADCT
jgi:hypothetical protein